MADACRAAVDDQARSLAVAWGLQSRNSNSSTASVEDQCTMHYQGNGDPAADELPLVAETSGPGVGRAGSVGTWKGTRAKFERWAPPWEALGVLSVPAVALGAGEVFVISIGRAAAGPCGAAAVCRKLRAGLYL